MRVVALYGPEAMRRKLWLDELRSKLEAVHGPLAPTVFDGESATLAEVFDELRSFSLLQSHVLVIVDKADQFVKRFRDAVERYAEQPQDHATLVLRSQTWNKGNLDRKIAKVGAVVRFDEPKPTEASRWLIERAKDTYERKLSPDGAAALVGRLGTSMTRLDTELAKLAVMVEADEPITAELVSGAVGRSSDERAWAMQDAVLSSLASGRARPALEMIHELIELADQPEVLVQFAVTDLMRKLEEAMAMQREGAAPPQIARRLRLWGEGQRNFFAVMRRLDHPRAADWLARALRQDGRAKSGFGDSRRNLECFCVQLADGVR